jgi:copper chaperone CopZ
MRLFIAITASLVTLLSVSSTASATDNELAEKVDIVVPGMHCAGCANGIRERLLKEPHVSSVTFNFQEKKITAHTVKGQLTDEQIHRVVQERKYQASEISRYANAETTNVE